MMGEIRELYESLSAELARRGVASNKFSELERLFHFASDHEKIQPEWRKLNIKSIKQLQAKIEALESKLSQSVEREKRLTKFIECRCYCCDTINPCSYCKILNRTKGK